MKSKNKMSLWIGGIGCFIIALYFPLSVMYVDYRWSSYKKASRPVAPTAELQFKMDVAHSNAMVYIEQRKKGLKSK